MGVHPGPWVYNGCEEHCTNSYNIRNLYQLIGKRGEPGCLCSIWEVRVWGDKVDHYDNSKNFKVFQQDIDAKFTAVVRELVPLLVEIVERQAGAIREVVEMDRKIMGVEADKFPPYDKLRKALTKTKQMLREVEM